VITALPSALSGDPMGIAIVCFGIGVICAKLITQ